MSQIKQIIAIVLVAVALLAVGIGIGQPVRAESASDRGSRDAYRDYHGMNGHGFNDSCPSGHSAQYCANYKDAYSTNWAVVNNADLTSGQVSDNTQSGAIGGNDVKTTGDNSPVRINQLLNQRQDSPQADSNSDNSDNNGVNPHCKAFCVN